MKGALAILPLLPVDSILTVRSASQPLQLYVSSISSLVASVAAFFPPLLLLLHLAALLPPPCLLGGVRVLWFSSPHRRAPW
jgi:hypothetical protein